MFEAELLKQLTYTSGSTLFADTTSRAGNWCHIKIITNTVFNTLTDATRDGTVSLAGVTFPANYDLYGNFTTIKLDSGSAIAYKK